MLLNCISRWSFETLFNSDWHGKSQDTKRSTTCYVNMAMCEKIIKVEVVRNGFFAQHKIFSCARDWADAIVSVC